MVYERKRGNFLDDSKIFGVVTDMSKPEMCLERQINI